MLRLLFLISALCAERSSFITAASAGGMSHGDLGNINFFCYPKDSCAEERKEVYDAGLGFLTAPPDNYSCSCDSMCSRFGTCCKDSPNRDTPPPAVMPSCRRVTPLQGAYMVDKSEVGGDYDPIWRERCEEEAGWKEDVKRIAPVTSLSTSITYKNYYCLRCHETTDAFLYWDAKLSIFYDRFAEFEDGIPNTEVTYDQDTETWNAKGADGRTFYADLEFQAPLSIRSLVLVCDAYLISNCSDSRVDEGVRNLCGAYMAVVYSPFGVSYRNVHCALCNSELEENLRCERPDFGGSGGLGGGGSGGTSLDCYFNFNTKKTDCGRRTSQTKINIGGGKIRVEHCIIPHYVVVNRTCVAPKPKPS